MKVTLWKYHRIQDELLELDKETEETEVRAAMEARLLKLKRLAQRED